MFDTLKKSVAISAINYVPKNSIIGIGSGSTINFFIKELSTISSYIRGVVPSSSTSEDLLKKSNIPIVNLNTLTSLDIYIDSADQINHSLEMIKGGGGALTREKIIASVSKKFLCIVDKSKYVKNFDNVPVPVEVIPISLNSVSREVVKLGGKPEYRKNFITDNGNYIIDMHNLCMDNSIYLEKYINNIPGVVSVGLFCIRKADLVLVSYVDKIDKISL
ncbi:ribose-5-phosphate isomerase RpiA [Buchnera aphidicola]|uniref:Ribose-5-phosphate isomerase A n=1 Tax=Buchnera aphidicola (Cinara cf. splendens/pseudotsugae 3390) TaxID=2518980 RepID=A0A451CXK4_9GAMM|nr:ribose-5-phosphate isomerase RpiA [Buchnera aphidicola]VFP77847.1 Ribose-5-phosphate isomerase A [Buchnera aphidicola (Cinara cf. splendens/pseudotsugae 3390)]